MKDNVLYQGRISARCMWCGSLDVYYILQFPISYDVSPSGKMLKLTHKKNSDVVRTVTERANILTRAIGATECNFITRVCRHCGFVHNQPQDGEEVSNNVE